MYLRGRDIFFRDSIKAGYTPITEDEGHTAQHPKDASDCVGIMPCHWGSWQGFGTPRVAPEVPVTVPMYVNACVNESLLGTPHFHGNIGVNLF